jgi:RNA polymerase sigma-70 factor (ECF subfamily)
MAIDARSRLELERLYVPLRRFAAAVGPSEIDPDDLVQEALVGALTRRGLDEYDDLGAYLRRSIVSISANHRRSFDRRRRAITRLGGGLDDGPPPAYPSDVADLAVLSPRARAVLWLVDVEGRSYREVAELLGGTEEAHRARASRARAQLRVHVEEAER